jgi:MoaA/NifB/PqqE/SkfB family radical SAM enzyme
LKSIVFSIDGPDAAVHDRLRGTPGIHSTVTDVIRRIKREKPSMSISVICIIMRETASRLDEFVRWAEEQGVDNVMFQPIRQAGGQQKRADWYEDNDLFVRDLEPLHRSVRGVLDWNTRTGKLQMSPASLLTMEQYFVAPREVQVKGRRCMLGQTELRIDSTGIVYVCDVANTTIGHVDDGPIRQNLGWGTRPGGPARDQAMPQAVRVPLPPLGEPAGQGAAVSARRPRGPAVTHYTRRRQVHVISSGILDSL